MSQSAVATLEKHKSSVLSLWMWECRSGADGPYAYEHGSKPTFEEALAALAQHQIDEHACPDCGGSGYAMSFDGTDHGACLRCSGHGVALWTNTEPKETSWPSS